MYVDNELTFSNAQAVTSTGDTASTNLIDFGVKGDIGDGEEMNLVITVDEAVTSAGAATVDFKLTTDDNTAFSSETVLFSTGAIGKATLVAGYQVAKVRLPRGVERALRVVYTVATAALTAGKFTAALVKDVNTAKAYPNNYDVA